MIRSLLNKFSKDKPSDTVSNAAAERKILWHPVAVTKVVRETTDANSLILDIPTDLASAFEYKAGQFLTFRFDVNGQTLTRCYSMSSSPVADNNYKVTVKRIEDGRVSNWINDNVTVGTVLDVMRPGGLFCLTERSTPLVLFSGGSGITPCMSILKTALKTTSRPIHLVYANRDENSIIFNDELKQLCQQHGDRLRVTHHLDAEQGFVTSSTVQTYVAEQLDADFYTCGPGPFMDAVEDGLKQLNIDAKQIFIERFVSPADPVAKPSKPAPSVKASETVQIDVELDGINNSFEGDNAQSILEQARLNNMDPPSACEDGFCGCCMAQLVSGSVDMETTDALTEDDIASNMILTCQAIPSCNAVTIKYPN